MWWMQCGTILSCRRRIRPELPAWYDDAATSWCLFQSSFGCLFFTVFIISQNRLCFLLLIVVLCNFYCCCVSSLWSPPVFSCVSALAYFILNLKSFESADTNCAIVSHVDATVCTSRFLLPHVRGQRPRGVSHQLVLPARCQCTLAMRKQHAGLSPTLHRGSQ